MSSGGAYGTKAKDTDFRKKWDKEEYAERAKRKDEEERERMQENEERLKQGVTFFSMDIIRAAKFIDLRLVGKRPRKGKKEDLPKPTELMKQRE